MTGRSGKNQTRRQVTKRQEDKEDKENKQKPKI